jgi:hypothetical protein
MFVDLLLGHYFFSFLAAMVAAELDCGWMLQRFLGE